MRYTDMTVWAAHELRRQTFRLIKDPQDRDTRTMCRCGARDGFGKLENQWDDDVWVCVRCGGPTYMAEEKRMGLAYFRGGPLDGRAYEVAQLTRDLNLAGYIVQYNWTPEVITSEQDSSKTARVWQHKETPGEQNRQAEAAASLPPARPEGPERDPDQEGVTRMTAAAQEAKVSTDGLRAKREQLKASRTDIERLSGLTVPMIARIEKGGPRTTQDEADKYSQALVALEKEQGGREPSSKGGSGADAAEGDGTEGGDTKGPQAPASDSSATPSNDTGGVVRLHEWQGLKFVPRQKGDMTGGPPVKWSKSPSASFTFVAFTRDAAGHETLELWETRRRRVRYANPEDVTIPKKGRKAG